MTRAILTPSRGPDGGLYLTVPVDAAGEYLVTVTPSANGPGKPFIHPSWPPGYFERTAGALPDFPDCDDGFPTEPSR